MKIPKSIKILGSTYKVKVTPRPLTLDDKYVFGTTNTVDKVIQLTSSNLDGKPLKQSEIDLTFMHELIHVINYEGMYLDAYYNEPFTEWLAKNMLLVFKQLE